MNRRETTVLVADDDPSLTDLYAAWLRERYAVRVAHSRWEAFAALDPDVDVVVLGRRLHGRTGRTGRTVVDELRRRGGGCRVAMVTGVRPSVDVLAAGFDEYVVKPVDRADLHDVVARLRERVTYDEQVRRLYGLADRATRRRDDPADDLARDLAAARERADDALASFDRDDFRVAFRDLEVVERESS